MTTLPKFFAPLRFSLFEADAPRNSDASESRLADESRKDRKNMRYVAYVRISSEDQVGNYSLDAQQRAIETWVAARGGAIAKVYKDEAQSGRTADRPAFQQMRKDARAKRFDALVVHKFDRFARNRTEALAVKSLLRYDFGIKILSVTEPSEDDDGPMGALVEGIMESVADWYSRNLATEVAKGKKERTLQGLHNNGAPFGYVKNEDKILVPDEKEQAGVRLAFELYATKDYSDADIAHILNQQGYKTKKGRPFSKDTVRDFLRNPIYLGKVQYRQYARTADGKRARQGKIEWYPGKHEPLINEALFDTCQNIRNGRASRHEPSVKIHPYLLRELVYCYDCCCVKPTENTFPSYGKMRPQSYNEKGYRCYRCRAKELGYECGQSKVNVEVIDQQVISILMQLKPPANWRQSITKSIGEMIGENDLQKRLEEIRNIIKRMDDRWDMGFITDKDEYIQQRLKMQQEIEKLTPVDTNDLERAADLLDHFAEHFFALDGKPEEQSNLMKQIVERVYVKGQEVVAVTLRSNCHLVLGQSLNQQAEYKIDPFLVKKMSTSLSKTPEKEVDSSGLDGI